MNRFLQRVAEHWPQIAVVLAALAVAVPLLGHPLIYDDPQLVGGHPTLIDVLHSPRILLSDVGYVFPSPMRTGYFRPLQVLALATERMSYGVAPLPFRAFAAMLHVVCSLLVLSLAQSLLRKRTPAALAAIWFALHPAHIDDLALVANIGGIMAAALVLLALWLVDRSLVRPSHARGPRRWAALCVLLACLSKETALIAPLALALIPLARSRDEKPLRRLRAALLFAVMPALAAAAVIALRLGPADVGLPASEGGIEIGRRLLVAPLWIGHALLLGIFPTGLAADYGLPWWPQSAVALKIAAGWIALLGLLLTSVAALRRHDMAWRSVGAGLALFVVLYLPTANLAPMPRALADHYLYLPSAGLALAFGAICSLMLERRAYAARVFAAVVLLCLLGQSWTLSRTWSSEEALWTRCAAAAPNSSAAHNGLGIIQSDDDDLAPARASFERSVSLDPTNYRAWGNLGLLDLRQQQPWQALQHFRLALEINPAYDNSLLGAGYSAQLADPGMLGQLEHDYVAASPNGPYIWAGAALACRDSAQEPCARQMIERFFENEPPSRFMKRELGELYQRSR
ncbi:MAG: hypothetical protein P9M14_09895 [Candidatus Alcyoniella australis]|nr:hypothetical protein [Candidatus Alcyoniella australis]